MIGKSAIGARSNVIACIGVSAKVLCIQECTCACTHTLSHTHTNTNMHANTNTNMNTKNECESEYEYEYEYGSRANEYEYEYGCARILRRALHICLRLSARACGSKLVGL